MTSVAAEPAGTGVRPRAQLGVLPYVALAIAAGATMPEAARLANEGAGIVVGKFGASTVTPGELKGRF